MLPDNNYDCVVIDVATSDVDVMLELAITSGEAKGDVVRVQVESPGWVHVVYERWNGKETTGWLRTDDLFPLP